MVERNNWLDRCSVELHPPHPETVPFKKTLREIKLISDSESAAELTELEDSKEVQVVSDITITHVNATEATMDYKVVRVNAINATTGMAVSIQKVDAGDSVSYTPTEAGYYGIMVSADGADTYTMDATYEIRYISPVSTDSPYKGAIPGWIITEFPDYYKLKLALTDDMNSDYEFQKYLFEILFAYVTADDNGTLLVPIVIDGELVSVALPSITNVRQRNTSSSIRSTIDYPEYVMVIADTIDYAIAANDIVKFDIAQQQHRFMFSGDEFLIPKFAGQAIPGKYLVFALRRRSLGLDKNSTTEMSVVYGIPVEYSSETIDITELEAKVGTYDYAGEGRSLGVAAVALKAQVGDYDPATTGRTITDDLNTAYTPIMKQGVRTKMDKIATGTDDLYEILQNKHLVDPLINDATAAEASYTVTLNPEGGLTGSITLTLRQPGSTYGNAFTVTEGAEFLYTRASKTVQMLSAVGFISTGQDFLDWYNDMASSDVAELQEDIIVTYTGSMTLAIPSFASPASFTGGVDAHALTSTAEEIDAVVSQYHKENLVALVAPVGTNDTTEGYSVGSRWYDTVGGEWYICLDDTEDNAVWEIISLSTSDLGSAAVADIVNDLTTGGTTDALSAEQGKTLEATKQIKNESGKPALAVASTLTTGAGDSEIDWVADTAGEDGDDISLTFEVPATSLSIAPNTAASEIILTAVKGTHPVSITLLGGVSQSLAVTAIASDITVQLATDGAGVVTSTAATVLAAIVAAMGSGQPLENLISSAVGGASYDGDTLMLAQAIDYFDYTDGVSVNVTTPTDIIVSVDYDGATDAPTSTATEVLTAVNLASALVTGTAGGAGTDTVAEMAADNLTGGVDGTPGAAGAIRYETGKLWISTDISTTAVSHWEYASLT